MDFLPGEEAGIKSVTPFRTSCLREIEGRNWGPSIGSNFPFDANKRRHTSFASVFVYAEVDEEIEIEVKPDDLKVDTYRASGTSGARDTTDSAVHVTSSNQHCRQCQNERSQHKNRATAMKMLKAAL